MTTEEQNYFRVEIRPSMVSFDCREDETLLEGAGHSGLHLFSNCQKGECGTCKVRIKKGQIKLAPFMMSALSMSEIDADYTLACRSYPRSDIVIVAELVGRVDMQHYSRTKKSKKKASSPAE
ncbi:MAG: 2Fe-2S iron-sulfur cluster binding domain-containing protein [Rhodospirillales bacterium]|jgi:ferredoxin|nr:2Fe-2S iron-sulfur cluster binding domain-containing protein [Rhodospirillales bacterium]